MVVPESVGIASHDEQSVLKRVRSLKGPRYHRGMGSHDAADCLKALCRQALSARRTRLRSGRRLDVIAASQHDRMTATDYQGLQRFGIRTVRDGLRWHRVEPSPGRYDWTSFLPMLQAACRTETEVIWDLCHYGYPDDLDIFTPVFVDRFARYAGAVARLVREETVLVPFYCPVNEISFWAWAGGEVEYMTTFCTGARCTR